MKTVSSLIKWILFVPVCLLSVAIALFNGLYPGSVADFLATNNNGVAEIIAFSVLGLFLACFVISLFDRKMSPAHMLRKNYFCGVVSVGAALAMAANAAFDVTNMINSSEPVKFMSVLTVLLTAVGGVTMLYLGLNHFSAKNSTKKISLLYLTLPLWCAAHLIDRFLNNTATPVAAGESLDLIMFVAMAMFFINVTMIHAVIPVKNSVKSAINFGLPTVVISFVYSISQIFDVVSDDSFVILNLVPSVVYALIALYAMGFVAELSFRSKTTDEQIILLEEDNNEFQSDYYDEDAEIESDSEDESHEKEDIQEIDDVAEAEEPLYENDEEKINFSSSESEEVSVEDTSEEPVLSPAFGGKIRVVEDDDEVTVAHNDDIKISADESEDENNIADELFKAAQQQDNKNTIVVESDDTGSDDEMILNSNSKRIDPNYIADSKEEKLKGPTTRETIMYEDDEFILSVDNGLIDDDMIDSQEDASAFIIDNESDSRETPVVKKSYEERLDEIDRLIISIQGGETPEDK